MLCLFVVSCVILVFSKVEKADIQLLYGARIRRYMLAALLILPVAYGIVYALLTLSSSVGLSIGFLAQQHKWTMRITHLWSSSVCVWVFATESAFWLMKGGEDRSA